MTPTIKEVIVKYIECADCCFQKSCLLPDVDLHKRFRWVCPQCSRAWSGMVLEDGSIQVKTDGEDLTGEDYIIIEKSRDLIPWVLLAQKKTNGLEEKSEFDYPTTLYLFPVECDTINNPSEFPQYRAVSGK